MSSSLHLIELTLLSKKDISQHQKDTVTFGHIFQEQEKIRKLKEQLKDKSIDVADNQFSGPDFMVKFFYWIRPRSHYGCGLVWKEMKLFYWLILELNSFPNIKVASFCFRKIFIRNLWTWPQSPININFSRSCLCFIVGQIFNLVLETQFLSYRLPNWNTCYVFAIGVILVCQLILQFYAFKYTLYSKDNTGTPEKDNCLPPV